MEAPELVSGESHLLPGDFAMLPFFTPDNVKAAYESRFHFGWYARGRQHRFRGLEEFMLTAFREVAQRRNYHIIEHEVEPTVFRALLSLRPEDSPAEVMRYIKGNIATAVRNQCGETELWSRGWFVRSVGHVTNDVVQNYVGRQFDHHRAAPVTRRDAVARARYSHAGDPSQLRASNHAKFEYNAHFVFVTFRRKEFLDLQVAEGLVGYWQRVCEKKGWTPWNIEVVWNHAHLFFGLTPSDAPGEVALSLLNNAEYFVEQNYGAALKDEVEKTIWQPGYYVGTVGSATTAQVKAYLASAAVDE